VAYNCLVYHLPPHFPQVRLLPRPSPLHSAPRRRAQAPALRPTRGTTPRFAGAALPAGVPTEEAYVAAYCARVGRAGIDGWNFYLAFAFFRIAAILQAPLRRTLRRCGRDLWMDREGAAQAPLRCSPRPGSRASVAAR
jgi:hypothetical protein